jgi:hypothetical protein
MKKLLIISLAILTLTSVNTAHAGGKASFSLSPKLGTYNVGGIYRLDVFIYPNGETVDTVRVKINFPADALKVENVSKNSAFSYTTGGNAIDNEKGLVSFGSGIPGGTLKSTRFLSIDFHIKKEGKKQIVLNADSIMAGDGQNLSNGRPFIATAEFRIAPKSEAGKMSVLGSKIYPNGSILKSKTDKKFYSITDGTKRRISDKNEIRKLDVKKIIEVDESIIRKIADYSVKKILTNSISEGSLIRDPAGKIYVIKAGKRYHILNQAELKFYARGKQTTVLNANKAELDRYPQAKK